MQPLTPSERREVEKVKSFLNKPIDNLPEPYNCYKIKDDNRDLWLKVLSMALEHNEQIEQEWRNKR